MTQSNKLSRDAIYRLGLPSNLVKYIREGVLEQKVREAYRTLDGLNARLDAWEAANPEFAKLVPWAEARETWKAAGRPRAAWYEALRWQEERFHVPITKKEVRQYLLCVNNDPSLNTAGKPKVKPKKP